MAEPPHTAWSASAALVTAYATTAAMWGLAFLLRLPGIALPSAALGILLLLCMVGGGALAGSCSRPGLRVGAVCGLLVALLNLMILGSLMGGEAPDELVRSRLLGQLLGEEDASSLWWVPGWLLCGALLGALGSGLLARVLPAPPAPVPPARWTFRFALVGVVATGLLLLVGGLVTSKEAGMDVPDWPSTWGYTMFLFPLSRMVGGVFYEHAHRLLGCLVGLTVLSLVLYVLWVDRRPLLRWLGPLCVMAVVLQGVLGGLRVTTESTTLALIHGVHGQLVFTLVVSLAVVTSPSWVAGGGARSPGGGLDRALSRLLVAMLLAQLLLGGLLRHLAVGQLLHITLAVLVWLVASLAAFRGLGVHRSEPLLVRAATLLAGLSWIQLSLGFVTLAATMQTRGRPGPAEADVILSTLHQSLGACILATAVAHALWCHRRLDPPEPLQSVDQGS